MAGGVSRAVRAVIAARARAALLARLAARESPLISDERRDEWTRSLLREGGPALIPPPSLQGIPGTRRVVRFQTRIDAIEEVCDPGPYTMERGLALEVDAALRVYVSDVVAAQWLGVGPDWGWGESVHAQGAMSVGAYACAAADAPTWAGPETVDTELSYETAAPTAQVTAWLSAAMRDPGLYTGLMILLMQACGPHTDKTNLAPAGWPPWDPRWYGVVRQRDTAAETLVWWLVYLGPSGCRAVALEPHIDVQCLVDGLYAGTWADGQAVTAEAWVLRTLCVPEGETGDELLTAEDVAYAHDSYAPLAHGWHFSEQITAPADAYMLSVSAQYNAEGDLSYDTRKARVAFSFDGETATAVLEEIGDGSVALALGRVWTWAADQNMYQLVGAGETWVGATMNGPVYAMYPDSGVEWFEYEGERTEAYSATGSGASAYIRGMGTCGTRDHRTRKRYLSSGNLTRSSFQPLLFADSDLSGNVEYDDVTLSATTTSSLDGYFQDCGDPDAAIDPGEYRTRVRATGDDSSTVQCGEPKTTEDFPDPPPGGIRISAARGDVTVIDKRWQTTPGANPFGKISLLITNSPNVVYCVSHTSDGELASAREGVAITNGVLLSTDLGGPSAIGYVNAAPGGYEGSYGGLARFNLESGLDCPVLSESVTLRGGVSEVTKAEVDVDGQDVEKFEAVVRGGGELHALGRVTFGLSGSWGGAGNLSQADAAAWDRLINPPSAALLGSNPYVQGPKAYASYGGALLYQSGATSPIHWGAAGFVGAGCLGACGGYDADTLAGLHQQEAARFVGAS